MEQLDNMELEQWDCPLTAEEMLDGLYELKMYCEDIGQPGQVVPAGGEAVLPYLSVALREDPSGQPRMAALTFQPFSEEEARYAKFVQFYVELECPVHQIDRLELLECLCRLNAALPLGCVSLTTPEGEEPVKVSVRWVNGYPMEGEMDQGAFVDALAIFDMSCEGAAMVLTALAQGTGLEEAMALIGQ